MSTNNGFNKIQINKTIDKDANGKIIKQSLMLNIRCNKVKEAARLFRELKDTLAGHPVSEHAEENSQTSESVFCNVCSKPMVLRKGESSYFYGCSGFPECRNTKEFTQMIGRDMPVIEIEP